MVEFDLLDTFSDALGTATKGAKKCLKSVLENAINTYIAWMHGRIALLLDPLIDAYFVYHVRPAADRIHMTCRSSGIDDKTSANIADTIWKACRASENRLRIVIEILHIEVGSRRCGTCRNAPALPASNEASASDQISDAVVS